MDKNGALVCLAALIPIYAFLKDLRNDAGSFIEKLSFAIKNAEITPSTSTQFVSRPKIEAKLNEAFTYTSLGGGSYTIVYGPKGIGKTELVDHVASGKKGVIKVTVSSANTKEGIIQTTSKKLLGIPTTHSEFDTDIFVSAVKKSGIIPTIIFEVERAVSHDDDVVSTVRSLSKELARSCRCIIVLSEANAALEFGNDEREKFIYVDEMEREEATQLVEKLKTNITQDDMEYVFDNIGTCPLDIMNLDKRVSSTYSVQDYVADVLEDSEYRLVAFRHKPILKALKDHPEGVSPEYFNNQKDEGVDLSFPKGVGAAMKSVNVIVYRHELRKYVLMSTAHRTALKSYEPIIPK